MPQVKNAHDAAKARDAAKAGITQVEANTNEHWKLTATAAALSIARRQGRLTTDDVWKALSSDGIEYQPHNNGAMGAIMTKLEGDGFIRKMPLPGGRGVVKVPSVRESSHARYITLWESLVHYGVSNEDQTTKGA